MDVPKPFAAEVTGPMLSGPDIPRAVGEAARSVAQADLAYLMEADGGGRLVARAASGQVAGDHL